MKSYWALERRKCEIWNCEIYFTFVWGLTCGFIAASPAFTCHCQRLTSGRIILTTAWGPQLSTSPLQLAQTLLPVASSHLGVFEIKNECTVWLLSKMPSVQYRIRSHSSVQYPPWFHYSIQVDLTQNEILLQLRAWEDPNQKITSSRRSQIWSNFARIASSLIQFLIYIKISKRPFETSCPRVLLKVRITLKVTICYDLYSVAGPTCNDS